MKILFPMLFGLMFVGGCASHRTFRDFQSPGVTQNTECTETANGSTNCEERTQVKAAGYGAPYGAYGIGYGPRTFILPGGAPPTAAMRGMEQIPYGSIALVPVPEQPRAASNDKIKRAVKAVGAQVEDHEVRIEKLENEKK